jgi:GT2 family glycosyltransferase
LTIVKRSAFDAIGGYDETHAFHEDVDLSLRLTQKKCALHILPETLYVWSFRRFRKQGTLQVAQKIIVSTLPVLLFQRPFKHMPGYVMGGQEYWKKKKGSAAATIQKFERNIKSFLHELFE